MGDITRRFGTVMPRKEKGVNTLLVIAVPKIELRGGPFSRGADGYGQLGRVLGTGILSVDCPLRHTLFWRTGMDGTYFDTTRAGLSSNY